MNEITEIVTEDQIDGTTRRVIRTFLKTTVVLLVGLAAGYVITNRVNEHEEN